MAKQLFTNVGGNSFKLITESINESNGPTLVRGGLSKVFSNGGKEISYTMLENVGLGYIKDVTEARKIALQEAKAIAKQFGYTADENKQKFIKEVGVPSSPEQTATPEEGREVQIGRKILQYSKLLETDIGVAQGLDSWNGLIAIQKLAQELIDMHTGDGGSKKPMSGWDTLQLGSH